MDLDAIEAAEKAMTDAPWRVDCCEGESAVSARNGLPITFWRRGVSDSAGIALLRNAAPELIRRIREQDAEIKRLRRFVKDMSKTCYSCESCGHARTTRECLRCDIKELREAAVKQNDAICQTLGKALGYPRYSDDPKNFPGATEANGVCVGDHVAESLADEAANEIRRLREACEDYLKGEGHTNDCP